MGQTVCKPGSVPATSVARGAGDGHSSGTPVTGRLARPTRATGSKRSLAWLAPAVSPLLGLAPGGVYRAAAVAGSAVRSYRTLSPLPSYAPCGATEGGLLSVALSLGSPPPAINRHRVSMEPGLSSILKGGPQPSDRLASCYPMMVSRRSSKPVVSGSILPVIFAGRKRR